MRHKALFSFAFILITIPRELCDRENRRASHTMAANEFLGPYIPGRIVWRVLLQLGAQYSKGFSFFIISVVLFLSFSVRLAMSFLFPAKYKRANRKRSHEKHFND